MEGKKLLPAVRHLKNELVVLSAEGSSICDMYPCVVKVTGMASASRRVEDPFQNNSLEKRLFPWLTGARLFGYLPDLLGTSFKTSRYIEIVTAGFSTLLWTVAVFCTALYAVLVSVSARKYSIDTIENLLHYVAKKSVYLYMLPLCVLGFSQGMLNLIPFVRVLDQTLTKYATKRNRIASDLLFFSHGITFLADFVFEIGNLLEDRHSSAVEDFAKSNFLSGYLNAESRGNFLWALRAIAAVVEIGMLVFEECLIVVAWHGAVCFKQIAKSITAIAPRSSAELVLPNSVIADYTVLSTAVERFDRSIGFALLSFYSETFVWLLYEISKMKGSHGHGPYDITYAFLSLAELLVITASMTYLQNMALTVPAALRDRIADMPEGSAKIPLYLAIQDMTAYAPTMTLAGMFPITREFIGVMFGAMVTYTLLLWNDVKPTAAAATLASNFTH